MQRRPEGHGADQRNGNDLALGHHAVQILDPDRHKIHLRAHPGKMIKAALEGQQQIPAGVALAFGKQDQRVACVQRLRHLCHGVFGPLFGNAVDQHGTEHLLSDEGAQPGFQPVIAGGHGPGHLAQPVRQHRPDQNKVAVAGMVCKVDTLADLGGRAQPDRPRRRYEPRKDHQGRRDNLWQYARHHSSDPSGLVRAS